jgi:hypothetical protein
MAGRLAISVFLVPLLLLSATSPSVSEQTQVISQSMNAADSVPQNLLLRLLSQPFRVGGQVQIEQGRLPAQFPVDLIPAQSQVVASIVYGQDATTVLLDVAQSPEQIEAFYQQQLLKTDWKNQVEIEALQRNGFMSSRKDSGSSIAEDFCKGQQTLSLWISSNPTQNVPTPVRLILSQGTSSSCRNLAASRFQVPLPGLFAPPSTEVSLTGGGGGEVDYQSSMTLQTQLDSQAIATHYETQLQQAGWTRRAGGQTNPLLWSLWTFQDAQGQSWQGMFSLIQLDASGHCYSGFIRIFNADTLVSQLPQAVALVDQTRMIPQPLALRLLGRSSSQAEIWADQLPASLPFELPLPDKAQVVGSLVEQSERFQIILNAPQSPQQVKDFYANRLSKMGWQQAFLGRELERFGFLTLGYTLYNSVRFCKGVHGPELSLDIYPASPPLTDVRLSFNLGNNPHSFCQLLDRPSGYGDEKISQMPLPSLTVPPETQAFWGGGGLRGGGLRGDAFDSSAILQTQLSPEALATAYETQLEQAGWTRSAQSEGAIHVSLWTIADTQGQIWHALLSLTETGVSPHQYFAYLRIAK